MPLFQVQPALRGLALEPTLMVVGMNHRTAPLAMRERFWISENHRYDVVQRLRRAEGIEEAIVLSTCCRTEFFLWASEPTLAANSVLQFLTAEHGLKLSEWERFYRLLDDAALAHIFRVTSGLEALVLGEPQIAMAVKSAWEQARTVRAAGHFLDAVIEKALNVSEKIKRETRIGESRVSIPAAALELAQEVFGSLAGRRVLLLGTGEMNELCGRQLIESGASLVIIDQSHLRAQELALALGGTAASLEDRWKQMLRADVVIACTGSPHVILSHEEAERVAEERNRVALVVLDLAMPRDVDPAVRRVDGILLYDLEGIERTLTGQAPDYSAVAEQAEKIVAAEAAAFCSCLQAERGVPTAVAMRRRLEQICREEIESFVEERGPFAREQEQSLHALAAQVIHKIAGFLTSELKEAPAEEQEQMMAAMQQLFHLESPPAPSIRAESEKEHEEKKETALASNF